jgi:prepilin-type N-terminal cleavage/methylation domain-containing protein/prepilin-type processing-associated H-X9-DG protein
MKSSHQTEPGALRRAAYTLIELLVTIGIIGVLAALVMPAISQGFARGRRIYCISNLHQTGIAFHGFAHGHDDKFPMQVPGAAGGSLEYVQAGSAIDGEYFFSYRHFLPLTNEMQSPKVLTCPADLRAPAASFASFQNSNLSYFVAANPEFGNSRSVLAGDRNLGPTYGSTARVGGVYYLKWTSEMHRYKGNVLFADGHVEQLNDLFSLTNAGGNSGAGTVIFPSVPAPAPPGANDPGPGGGGGGGGGNFPSPPGSTKMAFVPVNPSNLVSLTNLFPTNMLIASHSVTPPASAVTTSTGAGGEAPQPAAVAQSRSVMPVLNQPMPSGEVTNGLIAARPALSPPKISRPPPVVTLPPTTPSPPLAKTPVARLAEAVYRIPWFLLLLLLAALLELRRRLRKRQKARARGLMPVMAD